jgi:hypothetical protein
VGGAAVARGGGGRRWYRLMLLLIWASFGGSMSGTAGAGGDEGCGALCCWRYRDCAGGDEGIGGALCCCCSWARRTLL